MCAIVNEQKEDIKKYVKQLIALELEIKSIKEDMKQIKREAKENGILVKEISEAMRELKKEIKRRNNPNEVDIVWEKKTNWSAKNNYKHMPKYRGFFESSILTGTRFFHLDNKNLILKIKDI